MASDRLEVPAKIDSRHPEAMKKDPGLTPWAIKGELILNCFEFSFKSCHVFSGIFQFISTRAQIFLQGLRELSIAD